VLNSSALTSSVSSILVPPKNTFPVTAYLTGSI
jgi:hypothetical protein